MKNCIVISPDTLINREASWNLGIYLDRFETVFIAKEIVKASKKKINKKSYFNKIKRNFEIDKKKNKENFINIL